jgi:FkbM family methyltransferase
MLFRCFNGVEVPFDDALLSESQKASLSLPGAGTMDERWLKIWGRAFQPGDLVLDIGAHIGILSIHMAMMGGIVHAVEGAPTNATKLATFCSPFRSISVHPIALSDENKRQKTRFNDCCQTIEPQEIEYMRYDSWAAEHLWEIPKFIKMDIEGMESLALNAMVPLLYQKVRPVWQIEYHGGLDLRCGDFPGFVDVEDGGFNFDMFRERGYQVLDSDMKPVEKLVAPNNYFFFPNAI